jgi:hypothetical protein
MVLGNTHLHIKHIMADFVSILFFEEDAITAEGRYVCFALALQDGGLCGAGGFPVLDTIEWEEGRLVCGSFRNAVGGRALLGVDEGVTRVPDTGSGGNVFHCWRIWLGRGRLWSTRVMRYMRKRR